LGGSGTALITIAQFAKPFSVKLMSVAAVNTADDRVFQIEAEHDEKANGNLFALSLLVFGIASAQDSMKVRA